MNETNKKDNDNLFISLNHQLINKVTNIIKMENKIANILNHNFVQNKIISQYNSGPATLNVLFY